MADLAENDRAMPIMYAGTSGRQDLDAMAGAGRPIAQHVDGSGIGGRLHVFARHTPSSPPAVDHGCQGTTCG